MLISAVSVAVIDAEKRTDERQCLSECYQNGRMYLSGWRHCESCDQKSGACRGENSGNNQLKAGVHGN